MFYLSAGHVLDSVQITYSDMLNLKQFLHVYRYILKCIRFIDDGSIVFLEKI